MEKLLKKYPCELAKDGYCQYGGAKRFNYGFAYGTQSWCRYPGINRAVFPMLGENLQCPLLKGYKNTEQTNKSD